MADRRPRGFTRRALPRRHNRPPTPRWARWSLISGILLLVIALSAATLVVLRWYSDPGYVAEPYQPSSVAPAGWPTEATSTASSSASPSTSAPPPSGSASPSLGSPSPVAPHRPAPPPLRGNWPTSANTGVPSSVHLRSVGDVTVTKNGAVVSGLSVHGQITVTANNVVIKHVTITNSGKQNWGIVQQEGYSGLTVQDSQIRGNGSQEMQQGILNLGGGLTVRRTDISGISDGIASDQGLFEDNYLHDPRAFADDHVDMVQSTGSAPRGKSLIIRHNRIINTEGQTSAIGLYQDFGVPHDVTIENNYLAGGGYTVYGGGDGDKGTPTNIKVRNNTFGRDVFPKGGTWGPVAHWADHGAGNSWSGNVWADTGQPVT